TLDEAPYSKSSRSGPLDRRERRDVDRRPSGAPPTAAGAEPNPQRFARFSRHPLAPRECSTGRQQPQHSWVELPAHGYRNPTASYMPSTFPVGGRDFSTGDHPKTRWASFWGPLYAAPSPPGLLG